MLLGKYKNAFIIKKLEDCYIINMRNNMFHNIPSFIDNNMINIEKYIIANEERLVYEEIIEENLEDQLYKSTNSKYSPILGTFLLSSICNLNCSYCYAYNNENIMLNEGIGKKIVDYLIDNAIKKKANKIVLKFHGIGEPTLNFEGLTNIFSYAKEKTKELNLKLKTSITTNGVCSDKVREWLNDNIDNITISFDGFEDVQNIQRKSLSCNSYNEVMKTIDALDKSKITIRTTVTQLNVHTLPEWTKFLCKIGIKKVNYEPVIICGRAKVEKLSNVNVKDFVEMYNLSKEVEKNYSINVTYSGIKENKKTLYHCGAYGRNFVISPNGIITTCYEVIKEQNTIQNVFIIGNCKNNKLKIEDNRVSELKEYANKKRLECKGCFAEFNCSGGCLSRRSVDDKTLMQSNLVKCKITENILMNEVIDKLGTIKD